VGRNLAQAVGNIGNTVLQYGQMERQSEQHAAGLALQERIASMRDTTERAVAAWKNANATEIAARRAAATGRRAGGGGGEGMTPEQLEAIGAARSGMSVPEFNTGRAHDKAGKTMKKAFSIDDEGNPLEGPQTEDYENRPKYEALAKRARPGFVESMVDSTDWKGAEEADTERVQRTDVYEGRDVSAAGRRAAALKGTLPAAEAAGAKAGKDAGEADRKERAAIMADLSKDQRELDRLRADIVTRETPEGKAAIAELAEAMKGKKALLSRITPERMKEPKGAPAPAPLSALPPGAKQIGTSGGKPVYQTPDGKQYRFTGS
jgi:hypothetical protein